MKLFNLPTIVISFGLFATSAGSETDYRVMLGASETDSVETDSVETDSLETDSLETVVSRVPS